MDNVELKMIRLQEKHSEDLFERNKLIDGIYECINKINNEFDLYALESTFIYNIQNPVDNYNFELFLADNGFVVNISKDGRKVISNDKEYVKLFSNNGLETILEKLNDFIVEFEGKSYLDCFNDFEIATKTESLEDTEDMYKREILLGKIRKHIEYINSTLQFGGLKTYFVNDFVVEPIGTPYEEQYEYTSVIEDDRFVEYKMIRVNGHNRLCMNNYGTYLEMYPDDVLNTIYSNLDKFIENMLNGVEIELETTISPAIEARFGKGFK